MRYRKLGSSDLVVSEIALGSWLTYGVGVETERSRACLERAFELGINFIDTANVYSAGVSETSVGRALYHRRHEVVLATKVRGRMSPGANDVGLSRLHIMREVEASLKRLDTDYIDLYQIHRADPVTNIEDTLRALDDLVSQGKVLYIGCSNLSAWQLMKALAISRAEGLQRFKSTQSYYSLVGRQLEWDTIPLVQDQGLGLLVWSPLAGGFLSGKFTRDATGEGRRKTFDFPPVDKEKGFDVVDVLAKIAKERGASVAQVALAWVLANRAVTSVIIGARNLKQLDDNLGAVDLALSAEDLKALDDVSRIPRPIRSGWICSGRIADRARCAATTRRRRRRRAEGAGAGTCFAPAELYRAAALARSVTALLRI
jgi:aryl-alcohol dehydrogenase-like predicted oxidoreductase